MIDINQNLGRLAMRFRHDRDLNERSIVADEYADEVRRLISSGKWDEIPAMEDQLPDEYMPKEFFKFWSIR